MEDDAQGNKPHRKSVSGAKVQKRKKAALKNRGPISEKEKRRNVKVRRQRVQLHRAAG